MDYKHTENVQFEDDDYYYYVRAVPKVDAEKPKKKKREVEEEKEFEAPKPAPQIVTTMITDDTPLDEPETSLYTGPAEEEESLIPAPGEDSAFSPTAGDSVPNGDTQPFTVIRD